MSGIIKLFQVAPDQCVCILTTSPLTYSLYVTFKLSLRHILPAVLILLCILRPRTVVAKRISLILLGAPAVCECGPHGASLSTPHECPKMARYIVLCSVNRWHSTVYSIIAF